MMNLSGVLRERWSRCALYLFQYHSYYLIRAAIALKQNNLGISNLLSWKHWLHNWLCCIKYTTLNSSTCIARPLLRKIRIYFFMQHTTRHKTDIGSSLYVGWYRRIDPICNIVAYCQYHAIHAAFRFRSKLFSFATWAHCVILILKEGLHSVEIQAFL